MKSTEYDTLLHLSSGTETTFRSINNFLIYYLLWTGSNNQLDFISMNHLCLHDVVDPGIALASVANIRHTNTPHDFSNSRDQYLQGYWEVKDGRDYSAVSLSMAYPITPTAKLKGKNANWCYVTKYRRHSDLKEFYFIQMTQTFGGYLLSHSYKAISEMIQYIQKHYDGLYIIVGDFNVQGHEKVFQHFLGEDKYHICRFYKTITCNDENGLASPDGLVVAKDLYSYIEYGVDFYSGYSYGHYIVRAKLFTTSNQQNGMLDTTDQGFRNFLQNSQRKYEGKNNYLGNSGIFSSSNETMIGSPSNIRKLPIEKGGPESIVATKAL